MRLADWRRRVHAVLVLLRGHVVEAKRWLLHVGIGVISVLRAVVETCGAATLRRYHSSVHSGLRSEVMRVATMGTISEGSARGRNRGRGTHGMNVGSVKKERGRRARAPK